MSNSNQQHEEDEEVDLFAEAKKFLYNQSCIVPNQNKKPGEGDVRGCPIFGGRIVERSGIKGVRTLYDTLRLPYEKYPQSECLGSRSKNKDGTPGIYKWLTFREVYNTCTNFGSGLLELCNLQPGSYVGFYSYNMPACYMYNLVVVPLYDSTSRDDLKYIVNHAELSTMVCRDAHVEKLLEVSSECPCLKTVIQMNGAPSSPELRKCTNEQHGIELWHFSDVVALGQKHPKKHTPPQPNHLATICYTSGTTGAPKGAMLTHNNVCSVVCVMSSGFNDDDVYLSYLPLAHMYDRILTNAATTKGAAIGFYQGDALKIIEDAQALRPTYFASVPRLYNRIYDGVMAKIEASPPRAKALFYRAYNSKLETLKKEGCNTHLLWDALVFSKVRSILGGRVRTMTTGSAPLAEHVANFLRVAFSCSLFEGYGLTETCAGGTNTIADDLTVGHVGAPAPFGHVKLVDVPEMDYRTTDKPYPRGEICFRGAHVFQGYYKDEEKTREAFPDGDDWFHSGDIGMWLPGGKLKIIDRKKNIFKLAQGEYIAPEKIEVIYLRSGSIMQAFVHGDSLESCLVGVVVPDPEWVKSWAAANNAGPCATPHEFASLCRTSAHLKEAILNEIRDVAKKSGLNSYEIVHDILLHPVPFSIENGLLTPTFKNRRPQMKKAFETEIANMYERLKKSPHNKAPLGSRYTTTTVPITISKM